MFDAFANEEEKPEVSVTGSRAEVAARCKVDYLFLFGTLLGQVITNTVPEFHLVVFSRMVNAVKGARKVFAIPRSFAKTTLARLACVYYITFSRVRIIYIVSATLPNAKESAIAIMNILKSSNYSAIFGKITIINEQEGMGIFRFKTSNNKLCYIRALGRKQQIRGANIDFERPQLIVVDDVEDRQENKSPEQYMNVKRWFYSDLVKALSADGIVLQLGNLVGDNSMIKDHCASQFWESMHFGAITKEGLPLWPELWPLDKLKDDLLNYTQQGMRAVWFAEMMNTIVPDSSWLIKPEEIPYRTPLNPCEASYSFITVDPAISDKVGTAHELAVVVHAYWQEAWQVAEYWKGIGVTPEALLYVICQLAKKWGSVHVGIEAQAYQAALKSMFEWAIRFDKNFQQYSYLVFNQLYSANRSKHIRLATWAAMLKRKEYVLNSGDTEIQSELLSYVPSQKNNRDDVIDAAAYGVDMIRLALPSIITHGNRNILDVTGIGNTPLRLSTTLTEERI